MAFTFAQTNEGNESGTYDLEISINPNDGVLDPTVLEVGEQATGLISVVNTGEVNAQVYLTADWGPSTGTNEREATLLANALDISVFISAIADPTAEFGGRFMDLIDQEILELDSGNEMDVGISVIMPDDKTGPTLLDKSILADFVFVAISVE